MSRSTLSLFFVLPLLASLFLKSNKKILIGLIPLLLQACWGIKNYYVFGQFQFQMSSLAGSIIQTPLQHAGLRKDFIEYTFRNSKTNEVCALHFIENPTQVDPICHDIIEKVMALDGALQEKIDGSGKFAAGRNSYTDYRITQEVMPAYTRYLLSHPWVVIVLFKRTFPIFWQISEHGLVPWYGNNSPTAPTFFSIIRKILADIASANKVILNSVSLLAFIFLCCRFLRLLTTNRRHLISDIQIIFSYAFLSFSYIQFFSCVVGGIESNRYRFEIEPIIWILPFLTWRYIMEIRHQNRRCRSIN